MKKILLSLMIFGCFGAAGQVKNFAVSVSANHPFINSTKEPAKSLPINPGTTYQYYLNELKGLEVSYQGKTGIDASAKVDYGISKRFFVSTGLSVNYLRFDRRTKVILGTPPIIQFSPGTPSTVLTPGQEYGVIHASSPLNEEISEWYFGELKTPRENFVLKPPRTDKTTLYISLPILLGTSFLNEKIIVKAGITTSLLIDATAYTYTFNYSWNNTDTPYQLGLNTTISERKERSMKGYNSILLGGAFQATYLLTKWLGVDVSAQRSFTPIYTNDTQIGGKSKYTTISIGLSYNFPVKTKLATRTN